MRRRQIFGSAVDSTITNMDDNLQKQKQTSSCFHSSVEERMLNRIQHPDTHAVGRSKLPESIIFLLFQKESSPVVTRGRAEFEGFPFCGSRHATQ
jgi:hypothetical protein